MKTRTLILFASLLSFTTFAFAQATPANLGGVTAGNMKSTPTHSVNDTLTNAATLNQYLRLDGYLETITIQSNFTRLSGTLAGTVGLYGSVDGTGYTLIDTVTTLTNVATKLFTWKIHPTYYRYHKLVFIGSGTESVKVYTPAIWRKP